MVISSYKKIKSMNNFTFSFGLFILLVGGDYFCSSLLIIKGVQNLIQPRVSLLLIQEVDQLIDIDSFCLPLGSITKLIFNLIDMLILIQLFVYKETQKYHRI